MSQESQEPFAGAAETELDDVLTSVEAVEVPAADDAAPADEPATVEDSGDDAAGADAAEPDLTEADAAEPDLTEADAAEEVEDDPIAAFKADLRAQPGDWYVIHSYAGYENRVKANLENRIQSLNMEDYIHQVEVPME